MIEQHMHFGFAVAALTSRAAIFGIAILQASRITIPETVRILEWTTSEGDGSSFARPRQIAFMHAAILSHC